MGDQEGQEEGQDEGEDAREAEEDGSDVLSAHDRPSRRTRHRTQRSNPY